MQPHFPLTIAALRYERAQRARRFPRQAMSDPAWQILLDAAENAARGVRGQASSLGLAAGVPQATRCRHIESLVEAGLCARSSDPLDGRRVFVTLTPDAEKRLTAHFAALGKRRGA